MIADGHGGIIKFNNVIINLIQKYQKDIINIAFETNSLETLRFIEQKISEEYPNTMHGCMIIIGIINTDTDVLSYISVGDCSLVMFENDEIVHVNMKHKTGHQMDEFLYSEQFLIDNYDIEKVIFDTPKWCIQKNGSILLPGERFKRFRKTSNGIVSDNSCFLTLNSYTKPSEKIQITNVSFNKHSTRLFVGSDGIFDLIHENDNVMNHNLEDIIEVIN